MVLVAKKKVFEVEVPIIDQKIAVLATSQDALSGRVIKIDLTRMLKGKNLDAAVIIKKDENGLKGEFLYLKLMPSFIRRVIRKSSSYVEDSFSAKTKDGEVIIKPYLLTRKMVHRSIRKALRNRAREVIIEVLKNRSTQEAFDIVLTSELQREVSVNLKKIYPLALSEIRVIKLKR